MDKYNRIANVIFNRLVEISAVLIVSFMYWYTFTSL